MKSVKPALNSTLEKRSLKSLIANLIQFAIQFVQTILLVPILLHYWGNEKYGVWLAVFSFFTLLQTFDAGHQTYVGNEFNKYFHIDKSKAKEILGSSIRACFIIGLFELSILTLIILFNFTPSFVGISPEVSKDYGVELGLASIMLVWILSGNIGGILVRIILPIGMMARSIYLGIILKVIQILILMFSGFLQLSIFEACLYTAISSLLYSYGLFIYIRYLMPEFYPWWKGGSCRTGVINLKRSTVLTFTNLLEQFSNSGLILVITNFLNATFVPLFTTIRTLGNTALQGTGMILNPLYPDMVRYHATNEHKKLLNLFEMNWLLTGYIVNSVFVLSILFIEPLYTWWTKGMLKFDLALYSLIICSVIISNFSKGFTVYLTGINQLRAISVINSLKFLVIALFGISLISSLNLLSLGFALILGEIVAAYFSYRFTKIALIKSGEDFNYFILNLNLLALSVTIIILLLNYFNLFDKLILVIIGLIVLLILYLILFNQISSLVKNRIYILFHLKSK